VGLVGVIKTLKNLLAIFIGISVFVTGMGLTMAFGLLAFIGMPILVVGLGLLSAAIDEIE
jgi:hypothetical protein